jgi:pyroglutamyl-peptidase
VKYDAVDEMVQKIWDESSNLVLHVGVHGMTNKIHIEKCATNGFCKEDYAQKTLCDPLVCLENSGQCERLETKFDVDHMVKFLNENHKSGMFYASCDVGSYLCGYVYLKSLDKNPSKTLFVHVPPIDKPFSSEETSHAILKIIECCLINANV